MFKNKPTVVKNAIVQLLKHESRGKNELVVFESSDGLARVEVQTDFDTVWLTKPQIAELVGRERTNISRHISNIYKEGELEKEATCANIAQIQIEGGREIRREVEYFNLDMIISVGYRLKSRASMTIITRLLVFVV